MDDFLARLAERLSDLGVTAGLGSAVPAGPGVQKTTVRLTRGKLARAYRLLYGQAVSLADAGLARGAKPPTLVSTSFMTPRSAQALLEGVRSGPWPLVYADLVTSGDPRVRTVARQWRDRFAGPDQRP